MRSNPPLLALHGIPLAWRGALSWPLVLKLCLLLTWTSTLAANAQSAPDFSHAPGLHTAAFDLELSTTEPDAVIRYTLDGREPDETSPVYDGPIPIVDGRGREAVLSRIQTAWDPFWWDPGEEAVFRATVVRARAFGPEGHMSDIVTGTFFVDESAHKFSLPLISLVTDPDHFFDYDTGIYVPGRIFDENFDGDRFYGNHPANYNQRGVEWERPLHFEFFEANGSLGIRQNLGVRTHGGATRAYHLKALRLYARSDYGVSTLEYPFFSGEPAIHKRLLLRGSGNDLYQTMLRDAYVQSIVSHLDFETQAYRPALVFVNGEYWGLHNIRERYDDHYLSLKYGLEREDLVILGTDAEIDVGTEADSLGWVTFRQFVRSNDLGDPAVRSVIEQTIDVDSHIDYHVAQIFVCNIDWPGNNVRFWRDRSGDGISTGPGDGRWRWMLFDTDLSTANEPSSEADCGHLEAVTRYSDIFPKLLQAEWYSSAFLNRFADHLNSTFRAVRTVPHLDSMQAVIAPEIADHIARWRVPSNVATWHDFVENIRQFMRDRPGNIWLQLVEHFELGGADPLTVDVSDPAMGHIVVNDLVIDARLLGLDNSSVPYPWTGWYFNNVPVSVTARPNPGYRFVGWLGSDEPDAAISLTVNSPATLRAVFEVDDADPMRPSAHVLANSPYAFERWDASEPAGRFPSNMVFQQSSMNDPGLDDAMTGPYHIPSEDYAEADSETIGLPYNNTARTRINGLGEDGIALINTGRGRDLGAVVLAINTMGIEHATVAWTGGTLIPNSRVYAIRLQYRVGDEGPFKDLLHGGEVVEYRRNEVAGHAKTFGPIWLPQDAIGEPYVQLRWKYYHTGERLDADSGQRDMLRIDDIRVSAADAPTPATELRFDGLHPVAQPGHVMLPFNVSARRSDGTVDSDFTGSVTLSMKNPEGSLRGTLTRAFTQGIAQFDDIIVDNPLPSVRLRASAQGLTSAESADIRLVRMTERVMPAYIQGDQPDNTNRVPYAFLIEIEGLEPEAVYRFGNRVVSTSDPADQNGAGNAFYRLPDGSFVRNTDAPRFRDDDAGGRHGTFTTDAAGHYAGWFVVEPTGNARFEPGSDVFMRVLLNDGNNGDAYHHYLTASTPVRVTRFGDDLEEASAVRGTTTNVGQHVIVLYDAERGGRAIAATLVEPLGMELDERFAEFYLKDVLGRAGAWGAMLPNHLPDGIRRIDLRSIENGQVMRTDVSLDGGWGETDTRDPRSGLDGVLVIDLDAPAGPALLTPMDDTAEVVRDPLLTWTATWSQGYEVEVAADEFFVTEVERFAPVSDTTLAPGTLEGHTRYYWRVRGVDPATAWSAVHSFTTGQTTSIEEPEEAGFRAKNYPNPFSDRTTISFHLDDLSDVRIEVFDLLGRSVRIILDERRPSGRHEVTFNGGGLPSGVYFYHITADARRQTGRMLLLR